MFNFGTVVSYREEDRAKFYQSYIAALKEKMQWPAGISDEILHESIGNHINAVYELAPRNLHDWRNGHKELSRSAWALVVHGLEDIWERPQFIALPKPAEIPPPAIKRATAKKAARQRRPAVVLKSAEQVELEEKLRQRGMII